MAYGPRAIGKPVRPVAGDGGVIVLGWYGHATLQGTETLGSPNALGGPTVATPHGFVHAAFTGEGTWLGPDGTRTTPAVATGPDANLGWYAADWDPTRDTLVLFGGAIGKRALPETWEWHDGTWKRRKVKDKPTARSHAKLRYVPPLGGMVLTGGFHKMQHFYDLALYRDGAWMTWPHEAFNDTTLAPAFLVYDPTARQLVLGLFRSAPACVELWRLAGEQRWELSGRLVFPTLTHDLNGLFRMQELSFDYDPTTRCLIGSGLGRDHQAAITTIAIGRWLDALPPVEWPTVA